MRTIGVKFNPSSASRWLHCTASVQAIAPLPVPPSTTYADEGSVAHKVFDTAVPEGTVFPEYPNHPVTFEMIACAKEAHGYVARVCPEGTELLRLQEEFVTLELSDSPTRGRLDLAIATRDTLHVMDYKYGRGVREHATLNPQLMLYAFGAFAHLHTIAWWVPTYVELHILQPRLSHYDSYRMSLEELRSFWLSARQAAQDALGDAPMWYPSEDTCRWCPLSGRCEAQASSVYREVAPSFDSSKLGEEKVTLSNWRKPGVMSAPEMAASMHDVKYIRDWCDAVEARMREMVEQALRETGRAEAHGWKLKAGRMSARSWKSEHDARLAFRRAGLKHEDYTIETLKTPPALEKLVGAAVYRTKIAPAVAEGKLGNPSLVPSTDRAPAIEGHSVRDLLFSELDQQREIP